MWGTGRTPASLHVHTTKAVLDCMGGQALQEGPWTGVGWLTPLVGSNILDRELRESTVQVFWGKKGSMHGLGLGNSKLARARLHL